MANPTLVERDVEAGRALVASLDRSGFPAFALLWLNEPEAGRWVFVVGTERVDLVGKRAAYVELQQIAKSEGSSLPLSVIELVGADDALLGLLAGAFSVDNSDVRLAGTVINGVVIPDCVIYRMSRPAQRSAPTARRTPAPSRRTTPKKSKASSPRK